MGKDKKDIFWLDEAIAHESTPEELREITTQELIKKHSIPQSTYYYRITRSKVQAEILKVSLKFAKRHTPEVLENLGKRAKKNNEATKIYLNYVLQLSEKLDITTKGKELTPYTNEQIKEFAKFILEDGGTSGTESKE